MKFFKIILALSILLSISSFNIYATNVSGYIESVSNWTLEGSPYNIIGDVVISNKGRLTIDSGVVVTHTTGNLYVGVKTPTSVNDTAFLFADGALFYGTSIFYVGFRNGAKGTINNCTFDNANLWIENSSPIISNNIFKNLAIYPINLNQNESNSTNYKAYPTITGNTFENVSPNYSGIGLALDIKINYTLKKYQDFPYFLGDISTNKEYVRERATFTIDSNITIILKDNLLVGNNSTNTGTLNARSMTFTGNGNFYVDFQFGSTGTINNCTFDNAYLWIENSSPAITNNSFKNLANYPIRLSQTSDAFVADPTISGNTFTNVSPNYNGIGLALDILTNYTLKLYQDYKYYLGDISISKEYVRGGKTLTILPNVNIVLKDNLTAGYSATSSGILNADAATFSGDGSFYVDFQFGSTGTINNCTFDNAYLWVGNSSPAITNNSFKNLANYPIRLSQTSDAFVADPTISGNTFTNVSPNYNGIGLALDILTNYTLKLYQDYKYYLGDISTLKEYVRGGKTLTILPNVNIVLKDNLIAGYSATSSGILNAEVVNFIGNNDFYVNYEFGSTGTINNCTFDNAYLWIENSSPTVTNNIFKNLVTYPIKLTQDSNEFLADPIISGNSLANIPSNYSAIELKLNVLTNYTLKLYQDYQYYLSTNAYINTGKTLTIQPNVSIKLMGQIVVGTSVTSIGILNADEVNFIGNGPYYINFRYGSLGTINNCHFDNAYIMVEDSDPVITNNTIINGPYAIKISGNSNPVIHQNNFANLSVYAVENTGINLINAENNYWGDANGPADASSSGAVGGKVTANVDFIPFLTEPNGIYLPYLRIRISDPLYEESNFYDDVKLSQDKFVCKVRLVSDKKLLQPIKNIKLSCKLNNSPVEVKLNNNKINLDKNGDGLIDQIPAAEYQDNDFVEFLVESQSYPGNQINKPLEIKILTVNNFPANFILKDTISLYFAKSQKLGRTFDVSIDGYSFGNNPVDLDLNYVNNYLFNNKKYSILSIPMHELSFWNGRSLGFSSTVGTYFLEPAQKPVTGDVYSWTEDNSQVLEKISNANILQSLNRILDNYSFDDNYKKITEAFTNQSPIIIGTKKQNEKHSVLATKLTQYNSTKEVFLNVYDCDFPSEFKSARIDIPNKGFYYGIYNEFTVITNNIFKQNDISVCMNDIFNNLYGKLSGLSKKVFSTTCPVYLNLTNSKGQKSGFLNTGYLVNNIENAEVIRIPANNSVNDSMTIIYVPSDDLYTVEMKGYGNGQLGFEYVKSSSTSNKFNIISVKEISISNNASCFFDENDKTKFSVDFNGDGTIDTVVAIKMQTVTEVDEENLKSIPSNYNLSQNYPNPFNPVTNINFSLPKEGIVKLKIYDILGNEIKVLVNEYKPAGYYSVQFNAANLSSGVYFYRIETGEFTSTRKLIFMK